MKTLIVAAAAICLSGCASFPGAPTTGNQILQNLEGCKRTYRGSIGIGVTGSFDIECAPQAAPPADVS
jgi:hypothetical protein